MTNDVVPSSSRLLAPSTTKRPTAVHIQHLHPSNHHAHSLHNHMMHREEAESAVVDPFEACKNGQLELVKRTINQSNVNVKDMRGRKSTCLHFAAGFGRKEVCEYLLNECCADPSVKDEG